MSAVDFTELLSVAQTIAIVAALVATLYFSQRQQRAFAVDLETRVLNDVDDKFHRISEIILDHPNLVRTISTSPTDTAAEVPFSYYIAFFCAHVFHMRERGLLQDNEWAGWLQWMKNAFRNGTIANVWKYAQMESWFDPSFRAFVRTELLAAAHPE